MRKVYLHRILSICGMLAPPTIVVIIVIAGLLIPGYNQLTESISSLSGQDSPRPELMTAGFIAYGALIIGFSYGLYLRLRRGVKARIIWLTLTLYGIGMILAGVFQDSPGTASDITNVEGTLHNITITTAFFSLLIGMWLFARSVYNKPSWFGFTWFTIIAAVLGLAMSIIFLVQSHIPYSGLLQRIFYIIPLIWIEMVSIWLLRLSFKQ
jgi:hypothetical membrane protein